MDWDNNFDLEFATDEEIEETLDALLIPLAEEVKEDEAKTAISNPKRIAEMVCAYKIIKYITKGTKYKVSYNIYQPYKSMGAISIIGKDISFMKSDLFIKAAKLASNFNVYAKLNGSVQIDLTFHGLTIKCE